MHITKNYACIMCDKYCTSGAHIFLRFNSGKIPLPEFFNQFAGRNILGPFFLEKPNY